TNPLLNVRSHLMWRGGRIYYRRRVPAALRPIVGRTEVWRSLRTDSPTVAVRRSHAVAAAIEREFETIRAAAGFAADQTVLAGGMAEPQAILLPLRQQGPNLGEVYDAYMSDPTHDWSPTTRTAYVTTRRVVLSVLGESTPIRSISRADCRGLVDVLRALPRHASKVYPGVPPREAAGRARAEGRTDLINAANINAYLNKLGGIFNWAVKEEIIDRNPAVGLRLPDPTLRREKRLPFSATQLRAIFAAPLYTGCKDDGLGYATPGPSRPQNARFWIPLVGLFGGLRLNEVCQLDVADIKTIEGITCFVVTATSDAPLTDKRLKTSSSERVVPVHPQLLSLGFVEFVGRRAKAGAVKLFAEVELGATGYRSTTFSSWFARFLRRSGGYAPRTCFHSFRHTFRDGLREARIDRDIAMTLGGWAHGGGSSGAASVSDAYGSGYRMPTLFDAIGRVSYPDLDLSHLHVSPDDGCP
ncbi:MAG: site-specific integrase, partial [Planctomycetaceae bacterium]|nr:site-specific integrase [Planctomycetaceae bacterium]